jgi:hypothetical protein
VDKEGTGGGGGGAAAGGGGPGAVDAVVRHSGKALPSWPTTAAPPTTVAHGGRVPWGPHPAPNRWR